MFAYPCPFCQQRLLASPERTGQRTICPKCLQPIVIPRPEGESADEGRITASELLGESPSTIFVDDFHPDGDEADAMDLSLPNDQEEFGGFVDDSAELLPSLDDAPPPEPIREPHPVAASEHVGSFTYPARSLAAAGVVATTAVPHIGGLGPAAYEPSYDTPMPGTSTPTPLPHDHGVVVFHPSPTESADIAAELTTALTMRMKPPPEPPSDLRLSTGAWLAITASGLSLWMLSMMRFKDDPADDLLKAVGGLGILEIVISYVWIAYLSGRKSTRRGLEALLPPIWLQRLVKPVDSPGYRPLRFAIAGIALVLLALLGNKLRPAVQQFTGEPEIRSMPMPKPVNSPLLRLKEAESAGINHVLVAALMELASDQATFTATAEESPALLAELRRLRTHPNGEVRGAALLAQKRWAGLDAVKPEILAVLRNRSGEGHERQAALDAAREYKDREVARAVAAWIGYRGFYDDSGRRAADTLRAMGPPEAEDALLELFENEDLILRGLPDILAEIGGPRSVTHLRKVAAESTVKDVRDEAARTADRIQSRPK